jgi:hypothetical protein
VDGLQQILDVAKNLGTPGVTILSIAVIIIWLARQAISLRKDFEQSKIDSANSLLKMWGELEVKKPTNNDPNYEAIKYEVLRRFGIQHPEQSARREIPNPRPAVPVKDRIMFSGLGAVTAQLLRVALYVLPRGELAFQPIPLVVGFVIVSLLSAALALFVLGATAEKRSYLVAGFLAGLALPYAIGSLAPPSPGGSPHV